MNLAWSGTKAIFQTGSRSSLTCHSSQAVARRAAGSTTDPVGPPAVTRIFHVGLPEKWWSLDFPILGNHENCSITVSECLFGDHKIVTFSWKMSHDSLLQIPVDSLAVVVQDCLKTLRNVSMSGIVRKPSWHANSAFTFTCSEKLSWSSFLASSSFPQS